MEKFAACPRCGSNKVRVTPYALDFGAECGNCGFGDSRGMSSGQAAARLNGKFMDLQKEKTKNQTDTNQ